MLAVFRKELADHLASTRFVILLVLVLVVSYLAMYTAAQGIRGGGSGEFVFLMLFTLEGKVLPSFLSLIALLIPIVGIILGFDAVNSEHSGGTLSLVLAQPIFRDAFINGKFLAGITVVAGMLTGIMLIVSGVGLRMIGIPPSSEEILRLLLFLLTAIIYAAFWLGIGILFSVFLRRTATSALASIALWIFFCFFITLIARGVANWIAPQGSLHNVEVQLLAMRISPVYLFNEAMAAILFPMTRSLGPMLASETIYMLPNPLPLGQSLLLVWPHLTSLIALTAICFAISYIKFITQEIRAT